MKKPDIACLIDDDQKFTCLLSKQMRLVDFCDSILIFNDGWKAGRADAARRCHLEIKGCE